MLNGGNNALYSTWDGATLSSGQNLILPDAVWTYVAMVVEPTRISMYMKPFGGAMTSSVRTGTVNARTLDNDFFIGRDNSSGGGEPYGRRFKGQLDNFRLYGRALSQAEIAILATSLYNPTFKNGFNLPAGEELKPYVGSLKDSAEDKDEGEVLIFEKVSGPAWLAVSKEGVLSGTPAEGTTGMTDFRVRVTDRSGASTEGGFTIMVNPRGLSEREAWRKEHFGSFQNQGEGKDSADPDGDGLANLFEYAMGSHPKKADAAGGLTVSLSGDDLIVTYTRSTAAPGVAMSVKVKGDSGKGMDKGWADSVDAKTTTFPPRRRLQSGGGAGGCAHRRPQGMMVCLEAEGLMTPAVGMRDTFLATRSDTAVAPAFMREPVYEGQVISATANTVTVGGALALPKGVHCLRFGPAPVGKMNAHEGRTVMIASATESTLTLKTDGMDLSAIPVGTTVRVVPEWTLATLFSRDQSGSAFVASPTTQLLKTLILLPDYAGARVNRSAAAVFYFSNGAWRRSGAKASDDAGDTVIPSNTGVTVRHSGDEALKLRVCGHVDAGKLTRRFPAVTHPAGRDHFVSTGRPMAVTLAELGLVESGAFAKSLSTAEPSDRLIVAGPAAKDSDKRTTKVYYHHNGAWRLMGEDPLKSFDATPIEPDAPFLLRRRSSAQADWTNTLKQN